MKIENTQVYGFEAALHAMRNPMNSWGKSDSIWTNAEDYIIGKNDNELAKKLIKAGAEHRKFLRMIHISCFMTLPRYIWTEFDTYKVATTRLSCSTMHKLGSKELTKEDFQDGLVIYETLQILNVLGKEYRENKNVNILRQMKQILPEGFLQSANFDINYETAINIYHQRKNHKMSEWSGKGGICEWIEGLLMMDEWLNLK